MLLKWELREEVCAPLGNVHGRGREDDRYRSFADFTREVDERPEVGTVSVDGDMLPKGG